MGRKIKLNDLLYEPFYQMMRLQLLSAAMGKPAPGETSGEMGADIVSILHVSPSVNQGFRNTVTSPILRSLGNDIYDVCKNKGVRATLLTRKQLSGEKMGILNINYLI